MRRKFQWQSFHCNSKRFVWLEHGLKTKGKNKPTYLSVRELVFVIQSEVDHSACDGSTQTGTTKLHSGRNTPISRPEISIVFAVLADFVNKWTVMRQEFVQVKLVILKEGYPCDKLKRVVAYIYYTNFVDFYFLQILVVASPDLFRIFENIFFLGGGGLFTHILRFC